MAKTAAKKAPAKKRAVKSTEKSDALREAALADRPAPPPAPALSGAEIEKQLALAHKMIAECGAKLAHMLATRRLNLNALQLACDGAAACAEHMKRVVSVLQGAKKQ